MMTETTTVPKSHLDDGDAGNFEGSYFEMYLDKILEGKRSNESVVEDEKTKTSHVTGNDVPPAEGCGQKGKPNKPKQKVVAKALDFDKIDCGAALTSNCPSYIRLIEGLAAMKSLKSKLKTLAKASRDSSTSTPLDLSDAATRSDSNLSVPSRKTRSRSRAKATQKVHQQSVDCDTKSAQRKRKRASQEQVVASAVTKMRRPRSSRTCILKCQDGGDKKISKKTAEDGDAVATLMPDDGVSVRMTRCVTDGDERYYYSCRSTRVDSAKKNKKRKLDAVGEKAALGDGLKDFELVLMQISAECADDGVDDDATPPPRNSVNLPKAMPMENIHKKLMRQAVPNDSLAAFKRSLSRKRRLPAFKEAKVVVAGASKLVRKTKAVTEMKAPNRTAPLKYPETASKAQKAKIPATPAPVRPNRASLMRRNVNNGGVKYSGSLWFAKVPNSRAPHSHVNAAVASTPNSNVNKSAIAIKSPRTAQLNLISAPKARAPDTRRNCFELTEEIRDVKQQCPTRPTSTLPSQPLHRNFQYFASKANPKQLVELFCSSATHSPRNRRSRTAGSAGNSPPLVGTPADTPRRQSKQEHGEKRGEKF